MPEITLQECNIDIPEDIGLVLDSTESTERITPAAYRARAKKQMINGMRKEALQELIKTLPGDNEYIHIISNGDYDYYSIVPIFADLLGHIDKLWASTWTMCRANLENLYALYDCGKIDELNFIIGLFFKRRETATYATLVQGMTKRNGRYCACENHAKVMLFQAGEKYYVVEGSANWTANPRIEQYIITQSKDLFYFHKHWMNKYLKRED